MSIFHNILKNAKINKVTADGANYSVPAGTGDTLNGTEIDMLGYDSCLIIADIGAIAANGSVTGRLKNSDTSGTYGSGTIDMIGTALANAADTDDDKLMVWDIYKPLRRYLRLTLIRATGNVTINSVMVIRYNASATPVTQASTVANVMASQTLASPTPSAT